MLKRALCGTVLLGLAVALAGPAQAGDDDNRGSIGKKGSLLVFPYVVLRWRDGALGQPKNGSWSLNNELIEDTFISVESNGLNPVDIKGFFVNGDGPYSEAGCSGCGNGGNHSGWVHPDVTGILCGSSVSANGSRSYWSAFAGNQQGSLFSTNWTAIDNGDNLGGGKPGRPDPVCNGDQNPPDADCDRLIRGFIVMWATPDDTRDLLNYNHLSGYATIVNYDEGTVVEYQAWAFAMTTGNAGDEFEGGLISFGSGPGGGLPVYDYAPEKLLFDFYAESDDISVNDAFTKSATGAKPVIIQQTDLTLHVLDANLNTPGQGGGPRATLATFDVHDQNEVGHSGAELCVTCWDSRPIGDIADFIFDIFFLGTDRGKARIDGEDSTQPCVFGTDVFEAKDRALLGIQIKTVEFTEFIGSASKLERGAMGLIGQGRQTACIIYGGEDCCEDCQSDGGSPGGGDPGVEDPAGGVEPPPGKVTGTPIRRP
jgi:hypothetical protein